MNYTTLASKEVIERTVKSLSEKHMKTYVVKDGKEALENIKTLIPKGASLMNGSSRTLEQIGFVEYLKSEQHGWNNLHKAIVEQKDPVKQAILRKQSVLSDYYIGSAHALTEEGTLVIASNTGSQLPHIVFTSQNIVFVISTKKIVPTTNDAMDRLYTHVVPLESERMMGVYGVPTAVNKILVFNNENPMMGRNVHVILVETDLGF